jgi:lipopolysaccharide/colanic/teichoic acid biosynthesis glycosyltransferase
MEHGVNNRLKERIDENGWDSNGKPNDEPIISKTAAKLRKFFIDEAPQIIYNIILNEDMQWVGERPQPADMWDKKIEDRIVTQKEMNETLQSKPGLCGVQYRHPDLPVEEARKKYRVFKKSRPGSADLDYFIRIWHNIIFKGVRSR